MGWVADLLKEIPSATIYKSKLEEIEAQFENLRADHDRLKEENAWLKDELNKFQNKGGQLGDLEVKILMFLSEHNGHDFQAQNIAGRLEVHPAKMQHLLNKLVESGHVYQSLNALTGSSYSIDDKGLEFVVTNDLIK